MEVEHVDVKVLHAKYGEQMKTAFNRIEKLEEKQADIIEEIDRIKTDIIGLKGIFREELHHAMSLIRDDIHEMTTSSERKENDRLREQNEKYFKWFFWLVTLVLATIITFIITTFLSGIIK